MALELNIGDNGKGCQVDASQSQKNRVNSIKKLMGKQSEER